MSRKHKLAAAKRRAEHQRKSAEAKFAKQYGLKLDQNGNIAKGGKFKPAQDKTYDPSSDQPFRRNTEEYNSLTSKDRTQVAGRAEAKVYSGERRLLGIATLHKSNMVPVFDQQDAIDIARMRR
jgi:hypothetical protein